MTHDPATEILVRERIESKLREAEQFRLTRAIRDSKESEGWRLPAMVVLRNLFALFPATFRQRVVCLVNPFALGC